MNTLLAITLQAALLAAIVYVLTKFFARYIPPAWRAALWFLVIARLLIPIAPPSPLSLQNIFISTPAADAQSSPLKGVPRIEVSDPFPLGNELIYTANLDAAPTPAPFPWSRIVATLWAAGALVSLTVLLIRALNLRRRLAKFNTPPPPQTLHILQGCRDELSLRYPVRVSVSSEIAAPALTGILPARLIIPANSETLSFQELRHIFLHELAHIKLGHLAFHWVTLLARCLHWFNPLAHFAAAKLRQDCELAADAIAVSRIAETDRRAYGQTILNSLARATVTHSPLSLAMAKNTRHLEQRLQSLHNLATTRMQTLVGASLLVILTACGLTGPKQAAAPTKQSLSPAVKTEPSLAPATPPGVDPLLAANPNNRFLVSRQYRVADPAALIERVADQRGPKSNFPVQSHFNWVIHQDPGVQAEREADQIRHDDRALLFDEVTGIISARLTETELAVLEKELARLFAPASPTEAYTVISNTIPGELIPPVRTVSGRAARMDVMTDKERLEAIVTLGLPLIDSSHFREPRTLKTLTWDLTRIIRASDRREKPVTLLMAPGSEDFLITIRNLEGRCSIREFLNYIVAGATAPAGATPGASLQYSVDDNSVLFSVTSAANKVQTRFYQLPAGEDIPEDLKPFLKAITRGNTQTFFHNKIKGVLSVRASEDQLDELQERIDAAAKLDPLGTRSAGVQKGDRQNNGAQPISAKQTNGVAAGALRKRVQELKVDARKLTYPADLAQILKEIGDQLRANDPDRKGINIIIASPRIPENGVSFIERFQINLANPQADTPILQVFDSITRGAIPPAGSDPKARLGYAIEDYAVVFRLAEEEKLFTRQFRLRTKSEIPDVAGPGRFPHDMLLDVLHLMRASNVSKIDDPTIAAAIEKARTESFQWLTNFVTRIPRTNSVASAQSEKAVFYNNRQGSLFVRTTLSDLDQIENALSLLSGPVAGQLTPAEKPIVPENQQVTFRAQILEMPVAVAQELLKDLAPSRAFAASNEVVVVNDSGSKQVSDLTLSGSQNLLANVKDRVASTNLTSAGQEFFVAPSRVKALLDKAQKTEGVDQISAPILTTLIGRQARISIEESVTVMTPKTFPQGAVVPFGPVVDVIATEFDGEKLAYDTTLTMTEFLGYAQSDNDKPLPRFRVRQLNAKTKVQPGLTHIFSATLPNVGISGEGAAIWNTNAKVALFMITPTLVDGVGNIAFPEKHAK